MNLVDLLNFFLCLLTCDSNTAYLCVRQLHSTLQITHTNFSILFSHSKCCLVHGHDFLAAKHFHKWTKYTHHNLTHHSQTYIGPDKMLHQFFIWRFLYCDTPSQIVTVFTSLHTNKWILFFIIAERLLLFGLAQWSW